MSNEEIQALDKDYASYLEQESAQTTDINQKAQILLDLGLIEASRKDFDKSIKHLEEAQKYFLEVKNITKIAICLGELALIHYKKCNDRLIRSLTLLNDAKYLLENQKSQADVEATAKILHYYGIINYSEKHYSEALKYYKNAQELIDENYIEYAKVLDSLGIFYLRVNNYQIASRYLKDSLRIKKRLHNKLELATTELLIGRFLSNIESYDDAKSHLLEALQISKELSDFSTSARIYDVLANNFLLQDEYQIAREYCEQSLALSKKIQAPLIYAFSCCTLTNLMIREGHANEAIDLLNNEVEPIFTSFNSPRGYALVKHLKAIAFSETDCIDEAIESMHEAIDLFRDAEITVDVARSYYELSKIYKKNFNISMVVSSLLEALKIAKSNELPILTKKIEDLLYEIDVEEWANIINKTAKKEKIFAESKSLLEKLDLVSYMTGPSIATKDPLLSLLRIGRSIAAETDVDILLEIIAEETKSALDADRCTVFLLDKDTNELWSKVALGMGSQEIRFPAHMGLAGHVVITGESINIKDAYNDPRFNKEIDKKTGYTTKTILCMPMRNLNHEIVGVFQVLNKGSDATFTDEDEDLLIAIGSSAGIALENARLFKKQQLMFEEQKRSFNSFINTLAASIDARDKITAGHSLRVSMYASVIAKQMELPTQDVETIEYAATLHDFGKIGIKDSILCKEGKLTPEEYKHIQEHARITDDILKKMYFEERFKDVPEIASSHHEKWNGQGYFRGLKEEEIPLGGRILAVSDVFDAVTSKRHYRSHMPFLEVLNILKNDSGSHFDARIVETFFSITVDKILSILISANNSTLVDEEQVFFSKYTINDLYIVLNKEQASKTEEDNNLLSLFERYYSVASCANNPS